MGELYRLDFANGKSYIGISEVSSAARFHGHRCRAKKGGKTPLYTAWRKHGEPKLAVLAILENRELASTEIRAIAAFKTLVPHGYNVSVGGDISPMTNPEVAARAGAARVGRPFTDAHRAALSAATKGVPRPSLAASLRGKKHTEETKAKMSASAKANKKSDEHIAKLRLSAEKARATRRFNLENNR